MSKIRIPEKQLPAFKSFCKRFAKNLESDTGVRLRGNKLFNLIAQCAGHKHYKALLIDSGTYGNGPFNWDTIPNSISKPLGEILDIPHTQLWSPLMSALLVEKEAIQEINNKISQTTNPFSGVKSLEFGMSDSSGLEKESDSEIEIFAANAHTRITFDSKQDPKYLEFTRENDKKNWSFGEYFAGRERPAALIETNDEVIELLEAITTKLGPVLPSNYELLTVADSLYSKLSSTNGFTSLDLAGWLLDNGRKYDLVLCHLQPPLEKELLKSFRREFPSTITNRSK